MVGEMLLTLLLLSVFRSRILWESFQLRRDQHVKKSEKNNKEDISIICSDVLTNDQNKTLLRSLLDLLPPDLLQYLLIMRPCLSYCRSCCHHPNTVKMLVDQSNKA
mmetsp:Transcript_11045/g.20641  ORF Transcript_11045/g.20641 Transcript_11045/m.20641 type:complete len:106 (+) Transcript_11045:2332-2649(+)